MSWKLDLMNRPKGSDFSSVSLLDKTQNMSLSTVHVQRLTNINVWGRTETFQLDHGLLILCWLLGLQDIISLFQVNGLNWNIIKIGPCRQRYIHIGTSPLCLFTITVQNEHEKCHDHLYTTYGLKSGISNKTPDMDATFWRASNNNAYIT